MEALVTKRAKLPTLFPTHPAYEGVNVSPLPMSTSIIVVPVAVEEDIMALVRVATPAGTTFIHLPVEGCRNVAEQLMDVADKIEEARVNAHTDTIPGLAIVENDLVTPPAAPSELILPTPKP